MNKWFDNFVKQYFKKEYNDNPFFNYHDKLYSKRNVGKISIENNIVKTTLYPNGKKPVKIEISFKKFSDDEKEILKEIINNNIQNQLKINHGILPKELLESDIEILPDSLDDLKIKYNENSQMNKTIDALSVLDKFSEFLKRNNFLIFDMKGLKLKKKDYFPVKTTKDLFIKTLKTNSNKKGLCDLKEVNKAVLRDIKTPSKNFEKTYDNLFTLLKKDIKQTSNRFNNAYSKRHKLCSSEKIFDSASKITIDIDDNYNITSPETIKDERDIVSLIFELNKLTFKNLDYSIEFLAKMFKLTVRLIEKNALMPECFYSNEHIGRIRWIPAFYYEPVINLCKIYFDDCPCDLITFNGEKISKMNQVIIAISLIASGLIVYLIHKKYIKSFDGSLSKTIFKLFTSKPVNFSKNNNITTLRIISEKINPFYLYQLDYSYHITIDDDLIARIHVVKDGESRTLKKSSKDEILNSKIIYDMFENQSVEFELYEDIQLTNRNFSSIIQNLRPILEKLNVSIQSPVKYKSVEHKLVLDTNLDDETFNFKNLKNVKWTVEFESYKIPLEKFDQLTSPDSEIITLDEIGYVLDYEYYHSLKSKIPALLDLNENEIIQSVLLGYYSDLKFEVSDRFKKLFAKKRRCEVPQSLKPVLRQYQITAFSWLVKNIKRGFGCILADDIGLGKTLEVLSAILYLKENKFLKKLSVLLIVPQTLIQNWEAEIEKFTPKLKYFTYDGSKPKLPKPHKDIIITSYTLLKNNLEVFTSRKWCLCIVDEAQTIKNPESFESIAVKSIDALTKIAITSTPLENNIYDLWSIFDFINKGYLNSEIEFKKKYHDLKSLRELKKITKPFIMRRQKSDMKIVRQLPKKFINIVYCTLSEKQKELYEKELNNNLEEIKYLHGMKRRGQIFKTIMNLKKICNHPAQYSRYKNPQIEDSSKMELLMNLIENILAADEKLIIFTQFTRTGDLIKEMTSKRFDCEILFLNSRVKHADRFILIDKFKKDENVKIMISTIKTGGIGLNLAVVNHVIHYDLWWNPSVENQATDKAYRIGHGKNVMVSRLVSRGTIEERIDEIIENKRILARETLDSAETIISELDDDELKDLLSIK